MAAPKTKAWLQNPKVTIKFHKIKALDPAVRKELEAKLAAGESIPMVADWCREQNLFPDLKLHALHKMIARYRKEHLFKPLIQEFSNGLMKGNGKQTITKLGNLNAITEMEGLITIQKTRLEKALNTEKNLPMPTDVVRYEVEQLRKLLVDLANVYMEVGIIRRAPKQVAGSLKPGVDGGVDITLTEEYRQAHSDESRRLISVLIEQAGVVEDVTDAEVVGQQGS